MEGDYFVDTTRRMLILAHRYVSFALDGTPSLFCHSVCSVAAVLACDLHNEAVLLIAERVISQGLA